MNHNIKVPTVMKKSTDNEFTGNKAKFVHLIDLGSNQGTNTELIDGSESTITSNSTINDIKMLMRVTCPRLGGQIGKEIKCPDIRGKTIIKPPTLKKL